MEKTISFPVDKEKMKALRVGDQILISGKIYCGRDAVIPKIVKLINNGLIEKLQIELNGCLIFHTAVSRAGVGPTSSNKYEIESNIGRLSEAGVRMHLGKGALSPQTVQELEKNDSVYAVIPPVTALLNSKTKSRKVVAFEELGMEALYELEVEDYPAIVAVANGVSIYDRN